MTSTREKAAAATIGFRVKTGRATAVLLAGSVKAPRVLARRAVDLTDPAVPETREPYHVGLELPEAKAAPIIDRARRAVRVVAVRAMKDLADELRRGGHALQGVGLVVGSDIDPKKLGNLHVRAHALEGRLFREVLEAGADACGVPCVVLVERELYDRAAGVLAQPAARVKSTAAELGVPVGRPWTIEEKTAAVAAWLALAR